MNTLFNEKMQTIRLRVNDIFNLERSRKLIK